MVLSAGYCKISAKRMFRQGDWRKGLAYGAGFFAVLALGVSVGGDFLNGKRGCRVWVLREVHGRLEKEKLLLVGRASFARANAAGVELEEVRRAHREGPTTYYRPPTTFLINDTGRPLAIRLSGAGSPGSLAPWEVLKTTCGFYGDVDFAPVSTPAP